MKNSMIAGNEIIKSIAEEYSDRVWNTKDLSAIDDFLDPNCIIHSLLGHYIGHHAMKNVITVWYNGYPDLRVDNSITTSEKDRVILQWKASGTHLGEFKNIKPTGNKVSYEGVSVYRMENGKISEYWAYMDMQHLLNQIST